jgi:DNA-binding NtrC family response regulator
METHKSGYKDNVLERCGSDCEKTVIIHVLTRTKGNRSEAAEILGITKSVLASKIDKYEIDSTLFQTE